MSENLTPTQVEAASALIRLAPPMPGNDEITRVAERARGIGLASARSPWRRSPAVAIFAAVVVAALLITQRAAPTKPEAHQVGPSVPFMAGAGETFPFVPRDRFNEQTFGRLTLADLEDRFSIRFEVPETIAGGVYQGLYEPDEDDAPMYFYYAVYSNDTVIGLVVLPTAEDAQRWLAGYAPGDFVYHTHTVELDGAEAFAIPRLNVPLATDAQGERVPGTGVANRTARVVWRKGRFVIDVMSADAGIEDLVAVARGVTFEPVTDQNP